MAEMGRDEVLQSIAGMASNSNLRSLYEPRIATLDTVIADLKLRIQSRKDRSTNSKKQNYEQVVSSSTMREESAAGDTPDTSLTLDKEIENLFSG